MLSAARKMGASIFTTSSSSSLRTLIQLHHQQQQFRHFARWTPYKPLPKPKHHRHLRSIKALRNQMENCYLVSPFSCHGFSANQFKTLKPSDPSAAKLMVTKNSLVSQAFKGTEWEALVPCMKGMNALLFVKKEEATAAAMNDIKAVTKAGKWEFNEFTAAVVGGKLYGHLDLEVLGSMQSMVESDGMILGSLYSPASSLIALLQGFGDDFDDEKNENQSNNTAGEGEGSFASQ